MIGTDKYCGIYMYIHTELLGLATLRLMVFFLKTMIRVRQLAGFADSVLFSTTLAAQTKVRKGGGKTMRNQ